MLPQGIPAPGGAVAYRYRRGDGEVNTLYQLGLGVFTANGLAPYDSWSAFKSVLESGLAALDAASPLSEKGDLWCIIRYMDFFTKQHLVGISSREFFSEVVGVDYKELDSARALSSSGGASSMRFFYMTRDEAGNELSLDVGEGNLQEKPGIVMNTSVTSSALAGVGFAEVLECFDRLQTTAHNVFFEMVNRSERVKSNLQLRG